MDSCETVSDWTDERKLPPRRRGDVTEGQVGLAGGHSASLSSRFDRTAAILETPTSKSRYSFNTSSITISSTTALFTVHYNALAVFFSGLLSLLPSTVPEETFLLRSGHVSLAC